MAIRKLLADKFKQIELTINNYRNYNEEHFIDHLNKHVEFLTSIEDFLVTDLSSDENLMIEEYKLLIMKSIRGLFQPMTVTRLRPRPSWPKRIFGYGISLFGPIFAGLAAYLGCTSLFDLFCDIQHPVMLAFSILFGIVEGIVFIGSDVEWIAKSAGVSFFKTKPVLNLYKQQLDTIKTIHTHLLAQVSINSMSAKHFTNCTKLVKKFNEDVRTKQQKLLQCYQPTPLKTLMKKTARGIEAVLGAGSGLLMGKFIVGSISAAALSTPLGWMICGLTTLFFFASYYYLRDKRMSGYIDKVLGAPKQLMREQTSFIEEEEGIQKFNQQTSLILAQKKTQELEKQMLYNKLRVLQKKVINKHARHTHKLFPAKPYKVPTRDLSSPLFKKCRSHC